ncbi:hypothetical protein EMCG_03220 [[Emmonsia] crescens]|uniref:DUF7924 domain-containing protein n=1 Tax=[Emmonsia] crescens TaxID=73230 RepID=A0A0G2HWF1_9EURO|nr:hypothetical protein EMCG_03220 [Emmonsia crescens UAMH 3008]
MNSRYETVLESKGSFMKEAPVGITDGSRTLIKSLLDTVPTVPTVPENSLFRDDLFKTTCQKIQRQNEDRVIRDIGLLIVPSADTLATYGATHLKLIKAGTTASLSVDPVHNLITLWDSSGPHLQMINLRSSSLS